jgi:hypothetical protein
MIHKILIMVKQIIRNGFTVNVDWFYETDDDDMEQCGIDYQSITQLPFKMILKEEE